MAHSKADKQIIAEITKYRAITLVHRYLYYVKNSPLVSDFTYDMYERKLKELVTQNPQLAFVADNQTYCPTKSVGSDNPDDYPRRVEQIAEDILAHKGEHGKTSDVFELPMVPISGVLSGPADEQPDSKI